LPEGVRVYHANYIKSVQQKLMMLGIVHDKFRTADVKIRGIMTCPRYGPLGARGLIEKAFNKLGIGLNIYYGVFWTQAFQRGMDRTAKTGIDWILTVDYDSLITWQHIKRLLDVFEGRPDIDVLCSLQARRELDFPLFTSGKDTEVVVKPEPFRVTSAHFGLTLIRTSILKDLPKPWFLGKPNEDGDWEDGKIDPDIHFWHVLRENGKNIYVDPLCRIGHMEECARWYDENLQLKRGTIPQWRDEHIGKSQIESMLDE
jgi:hypothetical protein